MGNIARKAAKKTTPLNSAQGAILCGVRVTSLGLALIVASAHASVWPSGLEPAQAMYWCASDPDLNMKDAFTVWVDETKQVVVVSPSLDGSILSAYAKQLVLNESAVSGLAVKKAKTGYFLTPGSGGFSHQVRIANTVALCRQTSDD